jgi:hypothetical protein
VRDYNLRSTSYNHGHGYEYEPLAKSSAHLSSLPRATGPLAQEPRLNVKVWSGTTIVIGAPPEGLAYGAGSRVVGPFSFLARFSGF